MSLGKELCLAFKSLAVQTVLQGTMALMAGGNSGIPLEKSVMNIQ